MRIGQVPAAHPTATGHSSKTPWWLAGTVALAVGMLGLRTGWQAYSCHVVISQAAKSGHTLTIEPIGLAWLHRVLGRRWSYFSGQPQAVALQFSDSEPATAISRVFGCLTSLPSLRALRVSGTGVGDSEASQLSALPELRTLELSGTSVTARGLVVLDDLPHLTELALDDSVRIDDAALVAVSRASGLVSLNLSGTRITDAGLRQLSTLANLESLFLDNTAISDAGLAELKNLHNLRRVSLSQTHVTVTGIEALCEALPGLEASDD